MAATWRSVMRSCGQERRAAEPLRLWRLLGLWALALALWGALAFPRMASAQALQADTVTLKQAPYTSLDRGLSLWRDPGGRITPDGIAGLPEGAFTPLSSFSLGFTTDAIWLKFSVQRDAQAPSVWWLELRQPLLEDVQLFVAEPSGRMRAISPINPTGSAAHASSLGPSALAQTDAAAQADEPRPPRYRRALFAVSMPVDQVQTYYLRVQSQTAMSSSVYLWRPEALLKYSGNETFFWGSVFGAYALVILFYGAFWLWTRERVHGIYTLYVLVNFLAAFFTGNWPAQLFAQADPDRLILMLGFWISLSMPVGVLFSLVFIGQDRPLGRRSWAIVWVYGLLAAISMAMVTLGYYHLAMPALQSLSMLTILGLMIWVSLECWRGNKAARLYLLAFSFFYFGVAWRYLRNVGWVEPNFWNDNVYQIGAFVHMLLMSVGIFASYNRLRRDKEQAESRADAEASMRLEQRDFMAMLSHELRTPLTIMGASLDNLLDDRELNSPARQRVQKVQRASDRMRQLVESYLASERLVQEKERQAMNWESCDVVRLCKQIHEEAADQEGASLSLSLPPSLMLWCDRALVRIAITNLVSNACRYSPAHTTVTLKLELTEGFVNVLVQDQGPGIADSEKEHLFKRFFRGQHAQHLQGTGLGLYLVQAIAKRHGGSVSVRNLPDRGCEFCLRLPHQNDKPPGP